VNLLQHRRHSYKRLRGLKNPVDDLKKCFGAVGRCAKLCIVARPSGCRPRNLCGARYLRRGPPGFASPSAAYLSCTRFAGSSRLTIFRTSQRCPHFQTTYYFGDNVVTIFKIKFILVTVLSPFCFLFSNWGQREGNIVLTKIIRFFGRPLFGQKIRGQIKLPGEKLFGNVCDGLWKTADTF
jgi:hypothetical protein